MPLREVKIQTADGEWIRITFHINEVLIEVLEVMKLTPRFVRQIEEFVRGK